MYSGTKKTFKFIIFFHVNAGGITVLMAGQNIKKKLKLNKQRQI